MGILDWYDTNHDGHYSGAEIDRFQLDNAEYPGMFEHEHDDYYTDRDWDDCNPYSSGKHEARGTSDRPSTSYDGPDYDVVDYDKGIVRNENRCPQCLFWRDDYDEWSRDYGCRIFYTYVQKKAPYLGGGYNEDLECTCKKFKPRPGCTVDCRDCAHFTAADRMTDEDSWVRLADVYCDIWDRAGSTADDAMYTRLDGSTYFTLICAKFKLRKS